MSRVSTPSQAASTIAYRPTGIRSAECSLAITADGDLVIAPALGRDGVGIARSRDRGETWEVRVPDAGPRHRRIQPFTYLDPQTQRLFFKTARFDVMPPTPRATGYDLSLSDDLGDTWRHVVIAERMRDWTKLTSGPAPVGDPDRRPITYATGPVPFSTRIWPLVPQRHQGVERSRDGGLTWEPAPRGVRLSIDPAAIHGMSRWDHVNFGNGVVTPDGTLRLAGRYGRALGLATSHDGGVHWSVTRIPGSRLRAYRNPLHYVLRYSNYLLAESVADDAAGTILCVWPDEQDALQASWSVDGGVSWTPPRVVSAPGVTEIRYTSVTARPGRPGTFAIAYYGREASSRAYRAYLAQCVDLTAPGAVFVGGPVDPVDRPAFPRGFDPGYLRILLGGDLNEILQARYAPDGTLYVVYARQVAGRPPLRWHPGSRRARLPWITGAMEAVIGRVDPVAGA
ncbi:MAG: sialidase family protein [Solirubrobacteraceae bacterium]